MHEFVFRGQQLRGAQSFDRVEVEEERIALIVSETRKHILPVARRLGWVGKKPQPEWRPRLAWAAKVAAWQWMPTGGERSTRAEATAVLEHVLGIVDSAFRIGGHAAPVDPLPALVRLEAARPQPPRRVPAMVG